MGETVMSRWTRRPRRIGFVGALLAAFLLTAPAGASFVTEPVKIGTMDRFPAEIAKRLGVPTLMDSLGGGPSGSVLVSQELDRLYQIWNFAGHPTLGNRMVILERDLESTKALRMIQIPGRNGMYSNNNQTGTEWIATIDQKNHRLFIEYGFPNFEATSNQFGLVTLNLRTMKHVEKAFPPALVAPTFKAQTIYGIEYDETKDELIIELLGMDENFQITTPVFLVGWPGSVLSQPGPLPGPPVMQGPRVLRGCRQGAIATPSSTKISPIMIAEGPDLLSPEGAQSQDQKTWVVIPCLTTPYSVNTALIRMERSTLFSPNGSEQTIPAPAGIANWTKDDRRGRLYLLNAFRETDAWVYEVKSNAFIGLIELSPKGLLASQSVATGVDDLTGRLFAFGLHQNEARSANVSSIMISQAAQDPVPQADIYNVAGRQDADAAMVVDGKRNRIMLVRRKNTDQSGPGSWQEFYEIYEVPPPLPENEAEDPDSRTRQVKEKPGATTAEYGGTATAYGSRVLFAAGFTGLVPSNGNDSVGRAYKDMGAQCGLRDRELVLGGFAEASLASGAEPDALAEAVHLDQGTVQDFGKPSRCDLYFQYVGPLQNDDIERVREPFYFTSLMRVIDQRTGEVEPAEALCAEYLRDPRCRSSWSDRVDTTAGPATTWDYTPAECTSPGQVDKAGNNARHFRGDTWVDCKNDQHVQARAEGQADGVLGTSTAPIPIRIGHAISTTSVRLDPSRGLVSTATSRVEDIVIGPITIGFVENRAESFAKGRMGTAGTADYEPQIGLIKGPGFTACEIRCDLNSVIPQLNNALAGRAEFRALPPDVRLLEGSPGGYEAGIIKSEKQASSDNALVGDKSREVPALEIILYNDNPRLGRARQVIQLAGVRADSHYGIQVFEEGTPCGIECDPPVDDTDGEPQIIERVVTVEGPGTTRTITRPGRIRYAVPGGYRLLLANPRAAGGMLTVWLLMLAPFAVAMRRRRLAGLD